mmetsp:Transcript_14132/g.53589  ORF Transcript_14132/g.53589 Transcript_14132/m.53589 type:complete len:242 (-) Transcript_14132:611-1336(-)
MILGRTTPFGARVARRSRALRNIRPARSLGARLSVAAFMEAQRRRDWLRSKSTFAPDVHCPGATSAPSFAAAAALRSRLARSLSRLRVSTGTRQLAKAKTVSAMHSRLSQRYTWSARSLLIASTATPGMAARVRATATSRCSAPLTTAPARRIGTEAAAAGLGSGLARAPRTGGCKSNKASSAPPLSSSNTGLTEAGGRARVGSKPRSSSSPSSSSSSSPPPPTSPPTSPPAPCPPDAGAP